MDVLLFISLPIVQLTKCFSKKKQIIIIEIKRQKKLYKTFINCENDMIYDLYMAHAIVKTVSVCLSHPFFTRVKLWHLT